MSFDVRFLARWVMLAVAVPVATCLATGTADAVDPAAGRALRANERGLCLDAGDPGDKVRIERCDHSTGQRWVFDKDTFGPLRVAGTDVCLDAAAGPGQALRTTPCENATTQTWYYYPDNTIALGLTSACLTVASGEFRPGAHVEAMRCQDTANSQVWTSD